MFRIFIITCLFLFPTFAIGEEEEVKFTDFRIDLNREKTIYIKPMLAIDITEMIEEGNTVEESTQVIISIIFEF